PLPAPVVESQPVETPPETAALPVVPEDNEAALDPTPAGGGLSPSPLIPGVPRRFTCDDFFTINPEASWGDTFGALQPLELLDAIALGALALYRAGAAVDAAERARRAIPLDQKHRTEKNAARSEARQCANRRSRLRGTLEDAIRALGAKLSRD